MLNFLSWCSPNPEPSNEDAVSKVKISEDKLQPIIRSLPENKKIDNTNKEKDVLMCRALKKVIKRKGKKVSKHVLRKINKKGPKRVSKNKNSAFLSK